MHGPKASSTGTYGYGRSAARSTAWGDAFHTYSLSRQPGKVTVSIDGVTVFALTRASLPKSDTWVFDKPFYVLLNLAVGGSWPGSPTARTVFPATMLVDWLRVTD